MVTPEEARASRSRRAEGAVVALLLLFALALRLLALDRKNVWLDEAWTWKQTTRSVPGVVAGTARDVHPPLYPLLMKAWAGLFGDSPSALRSPSVVAGVLALFFAFRLGRPYLPRAALAGVLAWLAVSPSLLAHAQEARMYAMTTAAAVGACASYRRWFDSGLERTASLAAFAAWSAVAVYLHYFGILVLAAAWAHFLLFRPRRAKDGPPAPDRRRLRRWLTANGAIAALFLPWLPIAVRQVVRGQGWRQDVPLAEIPANAAELARGLLLGLEENAAFATRSGVLLALVALTGLGRLAFQVASGRARERDAFLLLVSFVPVTLGLAALPWTGRMDLWRYLSFLVPIVVLAIVRGFALPGLDPRLAVGVAILGAASSVPLALAHLASPSRDSDLRPVVAYMRSRVGPAADPPGSVFVTPAYMTLCTDYLLRGSPLSFVGVQEGAPLSRVVAAAARREGVTWVVVDGRSPYFEDARRDDRLREVELPGGQPTRVRLFRVRETVAGNAP